MGRGSTHCADPNAHNPLVPRTLFWLPGWLRAILFIVLPLAAMAYGVWAVEDIRANIARVTQGR